MFLLAVYAPLFEALSLRGGKAVSRKRIRRALFYRDRFHRAAAAVGVKRYFAGNVRNVFPFGGNFRIGRNGNLIAGMFLLAVYAPCFEALSLRGGKAVSRKSKRNPSRRRFIRHCPRAAVGIVGNFIGGLTDFDIPVYRLEINSHKILIVDFVFCVVIADSNRVVLRFRSFVRLERQRYDGSVHSKIGTRRIIWPTKSIRTAHIVAVFLCSQYASIFDFRQSQRTVIKVHIKQHRDYTGVIFQGNSDFSAFPSL